MVVAAETASSLTVVTTVRAIELEALDIDAVAFPDDTTVVVISSRSTFVKAVIKDRAGKKKMTSISHLHASENYIQGGETYTPAL